MSATEKMTRANAEGNYCHDACTCSSFSATDHTIKNSRRSQFVNSMCLLSLFILNVVVLLSEHVGETPVDAEAADLHLAIVA